MSTEQSKKARFIKPPNILKQKVGSGGIDESLLEQAQSIIDTVELDFVPYAEEFLRQLSAAVKKARTSDDSFQDKKESIVGPIMQLKANGGMFRYQLVSDVADIALQFVESVDDINNDGLDVIKAHENTIRVITGNKLRGDGGNEGFALVKELHKACKRYFEKHKPSS